MQKITYKETIILEEEIKDLIMINIDDKLNQCKESDCIKVFGEIKISGEANCLEGSKNFNHPLIVELLVSNDQLISNELVLSIDDFSYNIEKNKINIDLIMKVDGLKEIEAYFPAQENNEVIQVENRNEETNLETLESLKEAIDAETNEESIILENVETELKESFYNDIDDSKENDEQEIVESTSFYNRIFKRKTIKKEPSFLYHVVKKESSYEEIAALYGVKEELLKLVNNYDELHKNKLILIPKDI